MIKEAADVTEKSEVKLIAGGFSDGKTILLPNTTRTIDLLLILFHEVGHNIDSQFEIAKALGSIDLIKQCTVIFSPEERAWIREESERGWTSRDTNPHIMSMLGKLLSVVLEYDYFKKFKFSVHTLDPVEFNAVVKEKASYVNSFDENRQELIVADEKKHRNVETPADFIFTVLLDLFNRSLNRNFGLPEETRSFKRVFTKENDDMVRVTKIANFLFNKNWFPPSHLFKAKQILRQLNKKKRSKLTT